MSAWLLAFLAAAPSPFAPKLESPELYGETFSIVFDAEGTYALLQIGVSNIGPGDEKGACRFLLVDGTGTRTNARTFAREAWKTRPDGLQVGPCTLLSAKGEIRMRAAIEGFTIDATLFATPQPTHPPERRAETEDGYYEMELLVPTARAELRVIEKTGAAPRVVEGRAFMNHSRNTALPSNVARRWVRFRALDPERTHLTLIRFPPKTASGRGWSWAPHQDAPTAVAKARLAQKKGPLFRAQLATQTGTWTITAQKLLFRDAPLERYGFLGVLVSRLIGNPVTYTYRGTLGRVPGIMEVSLVE